jgi:hypothetical protein
MDSEERSRTPHAALHELLGRIIRVRAGMEPNFQSITERADKMSALAGEAILELVELEQTSTSDDMRALLVSCRPAVKQYLTRAEAQLLKPGLPAHYKPALEDDAARHLKLLDAIDAMIPAAECNHYWIPNSGKGGEPDFRLNRQMGSEPIMHVMCSLCGARTWFTAKQWQAIPATVPPEGAKR